MDVVLDTIGEDTFERSWGTLKPGGFLVTTVANVPEGAAKSHGVRAKHIMSQSNGKELAQIAAIIDERHIKPIVTAVLPLAEAKNGTRDERESPYPRKDSTARCRRAATKRELGDAATSRSKLVSIDDYLNHPIL